MPFFQELLLLFRYLLAGTGVTLGVSIIAISLGFVFGILLAILRVYGGALLSRLAAVYSTVVRGIPVVVIIFLLYFVIAAAVDLSPFLSGALALGFSSAAYQSEVFRGAFLSVPGGQMRLRLSLKIHLWFLYWAYQKFCAAPNTSARAPYSPSWHLAQPR